MLAIQGIYDGNSIFAIEDFPKNKKFKVIITFIEEIDEMEEVRNMVSQTDAFDFWHDETEDLYQEYLIP